jgi:hypothetical protein
MLGILTHRRYPEARTGLLAAEPVPELMIIGTAEGQILCNKTFADPTQN